MKPKAMHTAHLMQKLNRLGFTIEESLELFKIERTLHRWHERDANGEIYRDEKTGKVYGVFECHRRGPTRTRLPIKNMEKLALKKLEAIETAVARLPHPKLYFYVQGDPRGVALYICEAKNIKTGCTIDQCYTNGFGVYNR